MAKNTPIKLSSSITDFAPLFLDLEYMFKGLKNSGVDGVELVIGLKSRWSVDRIKYLSKKYNLPVTSIHQPVWGGLGLYFDEGFFDIAAQLGVKKVVCHPIPKYSFQDKPMQEYLKKLSDIKKNKGLDILLENLSPNYDNKLVDPFFPLGKDTGRVPDVYAAAKKHDLNITLDIDHLLKARPHKEKWIKEILPSIGNIHLSSFTSTLHHMPLYLGNFKAKEFIEYLGVMNYKGLLTFEIYYPSFLKPFGYDFDAIKKSIQVLRQK
jgi:sugar phosphate isomerase/epimerase